MEKYLIFRLDKSLFILDNLNTSGKCLFIKESIFFNMIMKKLLTQKNVCDFKEIIVEEIINNLQIDDVVDNDIVFYESLKNKLFLIIVEIDNLLKEHDLFIVKKNLQYHNRSGKTNAVFKWIN